MRIEMCTFVRFDFCFRGVVLLGTLIDDVSYVVVRLLAVLPWFAFIFAVVAGVVLRFAAGRAAASASNTEQDVSKSMIVSDHKIKREIVRNHYELPFVLTWGDRTYRPPC